MLAIRNAVPEDADAIALLMISAIRTAFRGRVPDHCLDWITPEESAANWRKSIVDAAAAQDASFRVAFSERHDLVGYVYAGRQGALESPVEIYGLSVRPNEQRSGIGRALLRQCLHDLRAAGVRCVLVRCITLNPSCAFWERMGTRKLGEEPYVWSGVPLRSALYVWDDIGGVLA